MKKESRRCIDEYRNTTNRAVFNKLRRKVMLVGCPLCAPNGGCNRAKKKSYGETGSWRKKKRRVRYPNWKLVTKKQKQWMEGTYRKVNEKALWLEGWIKFKF